MATIARHPTTTNLYSASVSPSTATSASAAAAAEPAAEQHSEILEVKAEVVVSEDLKVQKVLKKYISKDTGAAVEYIGFNIEKISKKGKNLIWT